MTTVKDAAYVLTLFFRNKQKTTSYTFLDTNICQSLSIQLTINQLFLQQSRASSYKNFYEGSGELI
jgi:hypothetical protein